MSGEGNVLKALSKSPSLSKNQSLSVIAFGGSIFLRSLSGLNLEIPLPQPLKFCSYTYVLTRFCVF